MSYTNAWLPTTKKEVEDRGWDELDVILISGDAYVDHPSFGIAVIGRLLESLGLKVAIIPQPNWQDDLRDFKKLGVPKLFFGVSAGAMDSMLNKYTAQKRQRSQDAYTPRNRTNARPDYPTVVYTQILKKIYPDVPVIIGGIEASLRRFTHFDYWKDGLMPSILEGSGADLLVYGMGEAPLKNIVKLLKKGVPFHKINTVDQTAFIVNSEDEIPKNKKVETEFLHSHEKCTQTRRYFTDNFVVIETESRRTKQKRLIQQIDSRFVVINPANTLMKTKELDSVYDLPYTRLPHPKYNKKGAIAAYDMIKNSVTIHRGCFGGCSFCTLSVHQGKSIVSRSEKSIVHEVENICKMEDFKGHISDLGGPSANMYRMSGIDKTICEQCNKVSCIFPKICSNLNTDHNPLIELYKKVETVSGVKKITIGSGVRYDMLLDKKNKSAKKYIRQLITKHVSGRLKVAPEHTEPGILKIMRKPSFDKLQEFEQIFNEINQSEGLNQEILLYFISSHPGCKELDMANLAVKTKNFYLEQVQDFTPTPMTLSGVMYFSGLNPYTGNRIHITRNQQEKKNQRMYFFWHKPDMRMKIAARLRELDQLDLLKKLSERIEKK